MVIRGMEDSMHRTSINPQWLGTVPASAHQDKQVAGNRTSCCILDKMPR